MIHDLKVSIGVKDSHLSRMLDAASACVDAFERFIAVVVEIPGNIEVKPEEG